MFKLGTGETLRLGDAPVFIRHNELKDGLCKIDGHGSSMHVGLLSFEDLIPTPMKTSAPMWRKQTGESIPSVKATANGMALGPRSTEAHHVLRGPSTMPSSARYLKR